MTQDRANDELRLMNQRSRADVRFARSNNGARGSRREGGPAPFMEFLCSPPGHPRAGFANRGVGVA